MDLAFVKELPTDLKRIVLNVLFLTPFWYSAIYLFDYQLIKTDLTSTFIISFCLAFIIQLFLFFPVTIFTSLIFNGTSIKKFIPHLLIELNTGFSIIVICFSISDSINTKFYHFYNFIRCVGLNALLLMFVFLIIILLLLIRKLRKARKQSRQQSNNN